jgi:hypothetical protein
MPDTNSHVIALGSGKFKAEGWVLNDPLARFDQNTLAALLQQRPVGDHIPLAYVHNFQHVTSRILQNRDPPATPQIERCQTAASPSSNQPEQVRQDGYFIYVMADQRQAAHRQVRQMWPPAKSQPDQVKYLFHSFLSNKLLST